MFLLLLSRAYTVKMSSAFLAGACPEKGNKAGEGFREQVLQGGRRVGLDNPQRSLPTPTIL